MLKAFVINLDRRPDRLAQVSDLLGAAGIDFERFAAFDGEAALEKEGFPDFAPGCLGPSEIGVFCSHFSLWRRLLASDESHMAIFEDDILISPRLAGLLGDPGWIDPRAEVVRLESSPKPALLGRPAPVGTSSLRAARLRNRQYGSAGYILSREGAERLCGSYLSTRIQVDYLLFDPEAAGRNAPLHVLQIEPALVIQRQFADPAKFGRDSDIMSDRLIREGRRAEVQRKRDTSSLPRKLVYEAGDIMLMARRVPGNVWRRLTAREVVVPFDGTLT
ncbi:glycosyltransferase family 25 protein [Stappia sp. F7233]|uniref:Glycosyltransferase family 25 protein n=1 Tax=Stappia albiluteola TaxID=2758565 RepID=A0A839A961_9HYPH|nr:glycosyltransferase family 25 protein [Stappia albiluteola]MBA5775746.1 glycosyltransferase family 25 protein [Stappia albiluteola]